MRLLWWLWISELRRQPARSLTAIAAIAIGVALGLAVQLVNRSALDEFGRALAVVNGDAQAQVVGLEGSIDESVYPQLARLPGVQQASPVIEGEWLVQSSGQALRRIDDPDPAGPASASQRLSLRILGIDIFRAAQVSPSLLPVPDADQSQASQSPLFADDTIFLSAAAISRLGIQPGGHLQIRRGLDRLTLRVAGTVPGAAPGQVIGIMDIASLQWRLGWLGRLSRVDLRLADGVNWESLERAIHALPGQPLRLSRPDASIARMSNLSRAYRVNLGVLSLVALFTGVFIVYATLALSVIRQRPSLALLGVLGASSGFRATVIGGQGLLLGAAGALAGVLGGVLLARLALAWFGADLGGGYFDRQAAMLSVDPATLAAYAAAGLVAALVGSLMPMLSARRIPLARGLKAGVADAHHEPGRVPALLLAGAGVLLLALPSWQGLPVAAYLAIACWLFGGIAFVPTVAAAVGQAMLAVEARLWPIPALWLGSQRVAARSAGHTAAIAGVVASFALATAMAIMVDSFRGSVDAWLGTVLPADLYARSPTGGIDGALDPSMQQRLRSLPGVGRVEFVRARSLNLDPDNPAVLLLARPVDPRAPAARLPLTGPLAALPAGAIGIYVSEAMVDLYQMRPGQTVRLPLGAKPQAFFVRGIWRDYARQHGSIVIDQTDYQRLTGDDTVNDIAIWLANGWTEASLRASLDQRLPPLRSLDWRSAADIRQMSLHIFDRSFTVTYLLEAIAMVVGLFGVMATFAGESIARTREFGMLRHLGVTGGGIARQLAAEAALRITTGVAWGLILGLAIAWVLIAWVNPQSFHWTMDLRIPTGLLLASMTILIAMGTAGAVFAARHATAVAPVRAVRQDW